MSPPFRAADGRWLAFYGSAKTESGTGEAARCLPTTSNNNTDQERVGLAAADSLAGPWRRLKDGNPVSLELPNTHTEQPITGGSVGYAWSPDGLRWHPSCGQRLAVNGGWGQARTPQGLVEEADGTFTLFFSGFDVPAEAADGPHESLGYARVAFSA
eukprot:gene6561-19981_t